eukprot:1085197-Pleurochrysis_carterae.AAC.1
MVTVNTVIISRKGIREQPISTQGKEDIRPGISYLYPSSIAQNGLRSHLNTLRSEGCSAPIFSLSSHSVFEDNVCKISKDLARVSPVIFISKRLNETRACMATRPSTTGAAIARSAVALDEDPAN